MSSSDRRDFLRQAGLAGMLGGVTPSLFAQSSGAFTVEEADSTPEMPPKHRIQFGVIGLDHAHIYSMSAAVKRGGGELKSFFATDPKQIEAFSKQFPEARLARSENEIVEDPSLQLVASASIPDLRAPLGVRCMRAGMDFLADKPGIVSLGQLAEVRRAIQETGKKFAIMYSERLEVRAAVHAGELVKQGAIGRVVQTVNLGPHRMNIPSRPAWFFDKTRYGGILCDIGSHQADQFLYYTNSRKAKLVAAQVGNLNFPQYPKFEDFGDMTLVGDGGTGYVRVDWFTPDGLSTWGDGRLFILGTEGYIELRKYINVASSLSGGNHLYIVDRKQARYIDCKNVRLPFGPQFVADIVNRTGEAQNQEQALLAAELVLEAQKAATSPILT